MKPKIKIFDVQPGFTLIEVMVSLFILSMVGMGIFLQINQTEMIHRELLHKAYAREVAINYVNQLSLQKRFVSVSQKVKENFGGLSFVINPVIEPYSDEFNLLLLEISLEDKNIYNFQTLYSKP